MKIYFKHSTRCPISAGARIEMDSFLKHNSDSGEFQFEFELIDVVGNRKRSIEVAEQLGIEHESPQLIIADDNNKVVWDGSHRQITEEAVRDALREYTRD